jgi:hypothetical protein
MHPNLITAPDQANRLDRAWTRSPAASLPSIIAKVARS